MTTLSNQSEDIFWISKPTNSYFISFHIEPNNEFLIGLTYSGETVWDFKYTLNEAALKFATNMENWFPFVKNDKVIFYREVGHGISEIMLSIDSCGHVEFGPLYNTEDEEGKKFWKAIESFHPNNTGRNRAFFMG